MLDILIENIHLLDLAGYGCGRRVRLADRHRRNVLQPRIARDRTRLLTHELHAVVLLRVVARRNHDTAAELQMRRRKVDHLRAALPDVHNVAARLREPLRERVADRRTGETNVMSDGDLLCAEQRGETASDTIGKLLVHLIGIDTAYIVCAKTLVCHCHVTSPPPWEHRCGVPYKPIRSYETQGHNKTLNNIR